MIGAYRFEADECAFLRKAIVRKEMNKTFNSGLSIVKFFDISTFTETGVKVTFGDIDTDVFFS
ncbi:hypothetical protein COY07_04260 [Candidatus Peregrinibacteria bacterium CG_4_10_14_0_2_um_filter_43_11]|nr:MAG: hypothetical protein COY07_04260 [Candidatus Peregrinibacteria bacterium CG_4_10_14_0_2_um_filter_43_11]